MRLLINAASANMGGAVTYLRNLARWLPRVAPQDEYLVYAPRHTAQELRSEAGPEISIVDFPYSSTSGLRRLYFDQVEIPRIVRAWSADVLFSATGFGTLRCPVPQVLLVRNALWFDEEVEGPAKLDARRFLMRQSLRKADVLIFPSRAVRDMVVPLFDHASVRCEVLPYGFDRESFFVERSEMPPLLAPVMEWKRRGETILLNVSSYATHKGLETLVEALHHLSLSRGDLRLVTTLSRDMTGEKRGFDRLLERIDRLGMSGRVLHLGWVPHGELDSVYGVADVFVFPSLVESFGHPVVEALASGLPIVAADIGVLRELCGDAALYFAPADPASCAEGIRRVLEEPGLREELRTRAVQQSKEFSWSSYAGRISELFQQAVPTKA